jgi:hypothetical protein
MIEIKEQYSAKPRCPFCESEVGTVYMQQVRAVLGKRYVYFCAKCHKILGLSHRKGFWMG